MPPSTRSRSSSREQRDDARAVLHSATTTDAEQAQERARQRAQRDARSVGRRLDRHQAESTAALNSLQGQMEQMTMMMASMQSSMARFAPPEGTNTTSSQIPHNTSEFTTPPPITSVPFPPSLRFQRP
jgi:hypothetical protein